MNLDIIALAFYASICGLLSAFAPNFGGFSRRIAIGAVVGIIAAAILPVPRSTLEAGYAP